MKNNRILAELELGFGQWMFTGGLATNPEN